MRVVVTGAAGFVGSHVCEALLDAGHEAIGIDAYTDCYEPRVKVRNAAELERLPGFRLKVGDVTGPALAAACRGAGALCHLAALPGVRCDDWAALQAANVDATRSVVDTAARAGVGRVVLASSSSVYGPSGGPVGEDAPLRPLSAYGRSKLAAERVAAEGASAHGIELVVLRYFTVYGPRQRPDMAFARFIAAAQARTSMPVFGDGLQEREWTAAADAARATALAVEGGRPGGVYNIAGGRPTTLRDAFGLIATELGGRARLRFAAADAREPRRTEANLGRAAAELGYTPAVGLEEGIAHQVEHARERAAA
jgi:UDP-glucuronate 4-epimerase